MKTETVSRGKGRGDTLQVCFGGNMTSLSTTDKCIGKSIFAKP